MRRPKPDDDIDTFGGVGVASSFGNRVSRLLEQAWPAARYSRCYRREHWAKRAKGELSAAGVLRGRVRHSNFDARIGRVRMTVVRTTHWTVRLIPAVVLALTALPFIVAGVVLPFGAAANNGAGSGQITAGFVVAGLALVLGGIALMWLARAVWRAKLWPTHVALVFCVSVIAFLGSQVARAFTPLGASANPNTGRLEPIYDNGAQLVLLAIVPYVIAVACLVMAEVRYRPRAHSDRS